MSHKILIMRIKRKTKKQSNINFINFLECGEELRTVQLDDDEMEISDDERDYEKRSKRTRYDSDGLKDENDSLRCQLEAIRNEMSVERSDSLQREKQIKVLQETIRNMQTQLLQTKLREQRDTKTIEQLERNLKEAGVKQLLLKTKIKETVDKLNDREAYSASASNASNEDYSSGDSCSRNAEDIRKTAKNESQAELEIIDIDKVDDDVRIIEHQSGVVEIHEIEDDEKLEPKVDAKKVVDVEKTQSLHTAEQSPKSANVEEVVGIVSTSPREETKFKSLAQAEAKIIALTSAFLVLHPRGVEIASIASYLRGTLLKSLEIKSNDELANILTKYTNLFKSEQSKWSFCGFTDDLLDANAIEAY